MAVSRFSTSSVAQGLPKYQKFWDGLATTLIPAGYFMGGARTGATYSQIRKMLASAETFSNISATLTAYRNAGVPLSNSGTAGYSVGGWDGSVVSEITDKLNQTNDTKSTIAATISGGTWQGGGGSNEGTAGYIMGGQNTSGTGFNRIDKILFSTDAKSTISATMSSSDGYVGVHNVNNKGVAAYTIIRDTTNAQKLTFPTETASVLSGFRSNAGYYGLGSSNDGTAGYISGGFDIPNGLIYPDSTDRIAFATDTRTTISNTLSSNGVGNRTGGYYNGASFGLKGNASYHCGGYREAYLDVLDRLKYSTETATLLGSGRLVVSGLAGHIGFANSGVI